MDGLTTKEAFEKLLKERNFHKGIEGLSPDAARQLRMLYKQGRVKIDKMEDILTKAGKVVIQEKLWI